MAPYGETSGVAALATPLAFVIGASPTTA